MFLSLGAPVDDNFVQQMLSEAPGPINFTMFLTLFGQNMNATDPIETLEQAFSCFDHDGTGKINKEDMEFMLKHVGDRYTQEQVDGLFRDCEVDEDGMFDYRQMAHIMKYGNPQVNDE